jgi:hypothetical protein
MKEATISQTLNIAFRKNKNKILFFQHLTQELKLIKREMIKLEIVGI